MGEAIFAFKSNESCVAVETGLFASLVLSTFPKLISPLVKVTFPSTCAILFTEVVKPASPVSPLSPFIP